MLSCLECKSSNIKHDSDRSKMKLGIRYRCDVDFFNIRCSYHLIGKAADSDK